MVAVGKNVVLMRDMTDTMYNPKKRPFVSHFAGTDLVVQHVEKILVPLHHQHRHHRQVPLPLPRTTRASSGLPVTITGLKSEWDSLGSRPVFR